MLSAQLRMDGRPQSLVPARRASSCADALHPLALLSRKPKPPSNRPIGARRRIVVASAEKIHAVPDSKTGTIGPVSRAVPVVREIDQNRFWETFSRRVDVWTVPC